MTIAQVLRRIDEVQPSSEDREQMIRWLRDLDEEIYTDVICKHEGWEAVAPPDYTEETDEERELLVPDRWGDMYVHWLQSKIDFNLQEYARFNNSSAAFQSEMMDYRCWYNREHMPLRTRGHYH